MAEADGLAGSAFERYSGDVYGWAYRVLGHHHDALDVVQDVFLRWHRQCARQSPNQPRGWLRRVTLNRAIDLRRQRRCVEESTDGKRGWNARTTQRPGTLLPSLKAGPTDVEQEELRGEIAMALDGLTDMQRSVLVAKVYDGMTFALVAEELGLSIPTVKTHYLRAVRAVRDRLRLYWTGEETS